MLTIICVQYTWPIIGSPEQAIMGLESQEVSARVTIKLIVTIYIHTCTWAKVQIFENPELQKF